MNTPAPEILTDRARLEAETKKHVEQCTACTTCGDRDTCECTLTEVLSEEEGVE